MSLLAEIDNLNVNVDVCTFLLVFNETFKLGGVSDAFVRFLELREIEINFSILFHLKYFVFDLPVETIVVLRLPLRLLHLLLALDLFLQ